MRRGRDTGGEAWLIVAGAAIAAGRYATMFSGMEPEPATI